LNHHQYPLARGAALASAFLPLLAILSFVLEARSQPCEMTFVTPRVESYSVSAAGGHLRRGSIHYVAGNSFDVELVLARCVVLESVTMFSRELSRGGYDSIEGTGESYEIVADVPLSPRLNLGRELHRTRLRVHFANLGRGVSTPVEVSVGEARFARAARQASITFTVVGVHDVGGPLAFSKLWTELENEATLGVFEDFRFGRYHVADVPIAHDVYLYDPAYPPRISCGPEGVHLDWKASLAVPIYCDPRASIEGTFTLEPDLAVERIRTTWPQFPGEINPNVTLDFGWFCDLASAYIPQEIVARIVENYAEGKVVDNLQERVDSALVEVARDLSDAIGLPIREEFVIEMVESFETEDDQLRVHLRSPPSAPRLLEERIAIEVPYEALDMRHGIASDAFAVAPDDQVLLVADARCGICRLDRTPFYPSCGAITVGANGLWSDAVNPFIVPSRADGGLVGERLKAYVAAHRVNRASELMPMRHQNPGAVIARAGTVGSSPDPEMVRNASVLRLDEAAPARIEFGVNDHTGLWSETHSWTMHAAHSRNEHGSGTIRISIVFLR
jgi:hypothetical protein